MPERRPGDRSIWGLFLVFGMAEAAIVPFLPLLLQDHGYSGSQIGLALAAMALAALLATPAWGHLGDVHLSLSRALHVRRRRRRSAPCCSALPGARPSWRRWSRWQRAAWR